MIKTMKKIIVKCKLRNRDQFEDKLSEIGMDFSTIFWQHDRVYVPRNYKPKMNFPRLIMRTEMRAVDKPAKYSVILRRHIEDSEIDIVNETVVKNYTEMAGIIQQLGFKQQAEVSRRRQEIKMGEGTILYLDNIEGVSGYFAKMETVLNEGDVVAEARADLEKTLAVLGEGNIVKGTYGEILSDKALDNMV